MKEKRIDVVRGDSAKEEVDAIIGAVNTSLLGGLDGAIHRAAGPQLLEECRALHEGPTGAARRTRGYRLSARCVMHTPGPVWRGGSCGETELWANSCRNSLECAEEKRSGNCCAFFHPHGCLPVSAGSGGVNCGADRPRFPGGQPQRAPRTDRLL